MRVSASIYHILAQAVQPHRDMKLSLIQLEHGAKESPGVAGRCCGASSRWAWCTASASAQAISWCRASPARTPFRWASAASAPAASCSPSSSRCASPPAQRRRRRSPCTWSAQVSVPGTLLVPHPSRLRFDCCAWMEGGCLSESVSFDPAMPGSFHMTWAYHQEPALAVRCKLCDACPALHSVRGGGLGGGRVAAAAALEVHRGDRRAPAAGHRNSKGGSRAPQTAAPGAGLDSPAVCLATRVPAVLPRPP